MKRGIIALALLLLAAPLQAARTGITLSPIGMYQGSAEIFDGQDADLEVTGVPYALYAEGEFIRLQFLHYEQFATDEYREGGVTGDGSVHMENDVAVLAYPFRAELQEGLSGFGYAGAGLFRSRATVEAALTDGVNVVGLAGNLATDSNLEIGFVFGGGLTRQFEDGFFVGAEGTFIVADTTLEGGGEAEEDVDLGALLFGLTAGAAF